jgi:hypothetical protein
MGYYILERNGTVLNYGDAVNHGSANSTIATGHLAVAIAQDGSFVTPSDLLPSLRTSQLRLSLRSLPGPALWSSLPRAAPLALRPALLRAMPSAMPSAVRPRTPQSALRARR